MEPVLTAAGRRPLLGLLLLGGFAGPAWCQARRPIDPANWEPLDEIGGIAVWFRRMSAEFDRYVTREKRAQLGRSVDRLRLSLYQLEQDSIRLRESIPDESPADDQRGAIQRQLGALMQTVRTLSETLREIGADLRLADPNEMWRVEERIFYGFRTRAVTLTYVQRELSKNAAGAAWPGEAIRARLTLGIDAIRDAQRAVIAFHGQLAS